MLAGNERFRVMGVNLYRAQDSEFGPYERVTELPVGALYWQDRTDNVLVEDEDVSAQFIRRGNHDSPSNPARWVFQTRQGPIVKEGSQATPANILRVLGASNEVELDPWPRVDIATQALIQPVLPGDASVVKCAYRYNKTLLPTDLGKRTFYRVTCVGLPVGILPATARADDLVETPLEYAAAASSMEVEKLDYVWREAIRRNRWILEQGGERVKAFLRKTSGSPCPCVPDSYHGQPINDCTLCFGTAFLGGYEGPFDIIVAPDDAEKRIDHTPLGRTLQHSYEVWTGPTPLLSQRDFLVKQNGDRYSLGPVRMPSNRGNLLQQHFQIAHFDERDIRYDVPVTSPVRAVAGRFVALAPLASGAEGAPDVTDKPSIPAERQERGRTKVWENLTY